MFENVSTHTTPYPTPSSVEIQVWAMAVKTFSPVLLLCIAAFSFAAIGSASLKGRPANRPPTKPIDARQISNVSFPLTQAPPPDPSSTVPDMSPTSTCQTYDCNLFYQVSHTALYTIPLALTSGLVGLYFLLAK